MVKRMLIDASHAEETRVVVANGTRLEEFDFESASKKQLKGNFYLARVMRVEPSLQAAFIEYGGNRHGFLPFGEIHPDYYQIPVADKEALFQEQEAAAIEEADKLESNTEKGIDGSDSVESNTELSKVPAAIEVHDIALKTEKISGEEFNHQETNKTADAVETLDGDEIYDETEKKLNVTRSLLSRRYKIQEVIKKRQIMLIQVVKEERGNKGAALTTYLSLAGRYCVLMPNAVRSGGISRKIVNPEDRKRLKSIIKNLNVPPRMSMIIRTAGVSRTRSEIKRDFEYLLRQWELIRGATLESNAPILINEEANLIRRSIRDLYSKDIEQILIEGDDGYRTAKSFMKTLIPSHSAKVQPYRDRIPLFSRYQIEGQLDAMYSSNVQLRSGGYLVINPTEALVSIDVNSGKATKQRSIEDTALKTNQEAADEIARQLRLRDLAGLVVIDFIDMDEAKHQRNIERRFKEAMQRDRARIQIGRISPFGLLELSRQRLRPSLQEAATEACAVCMGTGVVRATSSSAVHVLRAIEEEGLRNRSRKIMVNVANNIALYILNNKRKDLSDIEKLYELEVSFIEDSDLIPPMYNIDVIEAKEPSAIENQKKGPSLEPTEKTNLQDSNEGEPKEQARNRRRRRPRSDRTQNNLTKTEAPNHTSIEEDKLEKNPVAVSKEDEAVTEPSKPKRRRRGRRGSRKRPQNNVEQNSEEHQSVVQNENTQVKNKDAQQLLPEQKSETTSEQIAKTEIASDSDAKPSNAPKESSQKRRAIKKSSGRSRTRKSKTSERAKNTEADTTYTSKSPATEDTHSESPNTQSGIEKSKSTGENISEGSKRSGWWQRVLP